MAFFSIHNTRTRLVLLAKRNFDGVELYFFFLRIVTFDKTLASSYYIELLSTSQTHFAFLPFAFVDNLDLYFFADFPPRPL